ncbi:MAG: hypothetical protein PUC55_10375 [Lachnospiraceae bacterium]|nr:hypothetical protein [Lachnospiraceae bacterium]HCJ07258.1 hypothetical protein [Lachnospiraceae bacterium]
MLTYIIFGILVIFLIYMIVWTLKLHFFGKRQKKVRRIQELRAKGNEIKKRTIDCTKDYWYNLREVEDCKEGEDFEKYYHYFIGVDQGVHELLLEMYDCGIVRTDELEEIAYGKNHFRNVDLSFLEELEREMNEEESEEEAEPPIIQVEGVMDDFFSVPKNDVVSAAKNLGKNDPGIVDITGTLSDGVENVIAAVEAEKEAEREAEEPILPKQEKSVEEAQKARAMTANADVRNKIYEKWVGYVFELYEKVNINANEDTKHKIRKALMDYGYNDVDVLLEDPE